MLVVLPTTFISNPLQAQQNEGSTYLSVSAGQGFKKINLVNNTIGFCVDAADNGAISFLSRDTASNKTGTGFAITTGKGYDVYMYAAPNSSTVYWKIEDLNAGTEASGLKTLNLPATSTMLTAGVLASNAALTTVTATQLGINKIYIETDY